MQIGAELPSPPGIALAKSAQESSMVMASFTRSVQPSKVIAGWPLSEKSVVLVPSGPTRSTSRSLVHVWLTLCRTTFMLRRLEPSPATEIADGNGVAGPLSGMVILAVLLTVAVLAA